MLEFQTAFEGAQAAYQTVKGIRALTKQVEINQAISDALERLATV